MTVFIPPPDFLKSREPDMFPQNCRESAVERRTAKTLSFILEDVKLNTVAESLQPGFDSFGTIHLRHRDRSSLLGKDIATATRIVAEVIQRFRFLHWKQKRRCRIPY